MCKKARSIKFTKLKISFLLTWIELAKSWCRHLHESKMDGKAADHNQTTKISYKCLISRLPAPFSTLISWLTPKDLIIKMNNIKTVQSSQILKSSHYSTAQKASQHNISYNIQKNNKKKYSKKMKREGCSQQSLSRIIESSYEESTSCQSPSIWTATEWGSLRPTSVIHHFPQFHFGSHIFCVCLVIW